MTDLKMWTCPHFSRFDFFSACGRPGTKFYVVLLLGGEIMRFFILGEKKGTNLGWLTLGVLKYLMKIKKFIRGEPT